MPKAEEKFFFMPNQYQICNRGEKPCQILTIIVIIFKETNNTVASQ